MLRHNKKTATGRPMRMIHSVAAPSTFCGDVVHVDSANNAIKIRPAHFTPFEAIWQCGSLPQDVQTQRFQKPFGRTGIQKMWPISKLLYWRATRGILHCRQ
jgi:hypothetical protein